MSLSCINYTKHQIPDIYLNVETPFTGVPQQRAHEEDKSLIEVKEH